MTKYKNKYLIIISLIGHFRVNEMNFEIISIIS